MSATDWCSGDLLGIEPLLECVLATASILESGFESDSILSDSLVLIQAVALEI